MSDQPRLRDGASLEGRLLRSSTRSEPPASAAEELWQRLMLGRAREARSRSNRLAHRARRT
jgi:hypothetical protein